MALEKIFSFSDRCVGVLTGGIRAAHEGFWLGALSQKSLQALTARGYMANGRADADAYNLGGLFAWESSAVEQYFSGCRTLLVAAAGGGREVIALVRRGFAVDGFECNPLLAEQCRRLCASEDGAGRIFDSEPDCVPEELEEYDGAVVGWASYVHIRGRAARVRFLGQLRRCLKRGGPLLLSFFLRGSDSGVNGISHRVAKVVAALRLKRDPVELGDSLAGGCFLHRFTREEICAELEEAGFRVEHYSEMFEGHAVGIAVG